MCHSFHWLRHFQVNIAWSLVFVLTLTYKHMRSARITVHPLHLSDHPLHSSAHPHHSSDDPNQSLERPHTLVSPQFRLVLIILFVLTYPSFYTVCKWYYLQCHNDLHICMYAWKATCPALECLSYTQCFSSFTLIYPNTQLWNPPPPPPPPPSATTWVFKFKGKPLTGRLIF